MLKVDAIQERTSGNLPIRIGREWAKEFEERRDLGMPVTLEDFIAEKIRVLVRILVRARTRAEVGRSLHEQARRAADYQKYDLEKQVMQQASDILDLISTEEEKEEGQ